MVKTALNVMFKQKKKEENAHDTRQLLLDTATRLFAEQGYEGVSTRLLAKEAGVNMALIAYYFGSKEKLYEAIFEEQIPKFTVRLQQLQQLEASAWDKFELAIEAYVDRIFTKGAFNRLMFREMSLSQRPEHSERIISSIQKNWALMQAIITEGQASGNFRMDIDVELTMTTLIGTITHYVNAAPLNARLMHVTDEKEMLNDFYRARIKAHLKQLMTAHLLKL